jgi:hypothetical protein
MIIGPMIAVGRTAQVHEWRQGHVLKLYYEWCPADWAAREAAISRMVAEKGLPTPKCIETLNIDGRNGVVFERVNGISMFRLMIRNPLLIKKEARQLAELQQQINNQTGEFLLTVRDHLAASIGQSAVLTDQMKSKILKLLTELDDENSICHFDFHPDQVLITSKGPVILDWITALRGNPVADVAKTLVILTFAHAPYSTWVLRQLENAFRVVFAKAYLGRYRELSREASTEKIHKWMIPVAAARLQDGIEWEKRPILRWLSQELSDH